MRDRATMSLAEFLAGPLALWRERRGAALLLLLLVMVLTVLNPVGGLLLWLASAPLARLSRRIGRLGVVTATGAFGALYFAVMFAAVPALARFSGRVPLPFRASDSLPLRPATVGYCILGRNYVRAEFAKVAESVAREVAAKHDGRVRYLDAGLPFGGLPLLPHLSHSDGRKLDVAFRYRSRATGRPVDSGPSPIGYWIYVQPQGGEPEPCEGGGEWLRWDLGWLQWLGNRHELDESATRELILAFAERPEVDKILLEPHLKQRLGIAGPKVRFQGCKAARHDDHFHVQFR